MSLLTHFLIATICIAGAMLLRIFAERYTLRNKLRGIHADGDCEKIDCFRGCDLGEAATAPNSVSKQNSPERSANHAH